MRRARGAYQFVFLVQRGVTCVAIRDAAFSLLFVLVRRLHLATDRHIKHPYDNTMVHNGHGPAYWISLYAPITVTSHPALCGTGPGWT
jgi:hypothetical protein